MPLGDGLDDRNAEAAAGCCRQGLKPIPRCTYQVGAEADTVVGNGQAQGLVIAPCMDEDLCQVRTTVTQGIVHQIAQGFADHCFIAMHVPKRVVRVKFDRRKRTAALRRDPEFLRMS